MSSNIYRFRVGTSSMGLKAHCGNALIIGAKCATFCQAPVLGCAYALSAALNGRKFPDHSTVEHRAFLIGTDLFEYDQSGWKRRRNVGRENGYNWNKLGGKFNGTTYVSPDDLERAIMNSASWGQGTYKIWHNCQHFVDFCLEAVRN